MKYVQINANSWGWADAVILKKHAELQQQGADSFVIWGRGRVPKDDHEMLLLNKGEYEASAIATRLDGKYGFHNKASTKRLLDVLDSIQPDVVHLHSLIDYYVNVEMLFNWLASSKCSVIWTLHDCWPFTGGCMYFTMAKCDRWEKGCHKPCPCPAPERFPALNLRSRIDWCYEQKRRLFTCIPAERMTLIAPSEWMADLVQDSFLAKYPVQVVKNTIDEEIFKPTKSDFREANSLEGKFLVIGVASGWGPRKGMDDFIRLACDLDDRFALLMVGLTKKQIAKLPNNTSARLIGVEKTNSREQLAGIYTCSDILFAPTKEDNYPTVNLEAQACGTPVITYDVGGAKETLWMQGSVAVKGYDEAVSAIRFKRGFNDVRH